MARNEYMPTPDEIRAACALIRAERLTAKRERPDDEKRFATITPAAFRGMRTRDADEGLIV